MLKKSAMSLLFLSLSACHSPVLNTAQAPALKPARNASPATAALSGPRLQAQSEDTLRFPQDWEGHWRGDCRALGPGGQQRFAPFEMELNIAHLEDARWQWEITYRGEQLNQVRRYELEVIDAAQGHYLIDEKNGILLDHFTVGGHLLMEQFTVNQSHITGRHELRKGVLEVELSTFSRQPLRQSGSGQNRVNSYPLLTLQRCQLQR